MKYKNGTPYSDAQCKKWYSIKSSSELEEEKEEYIESQIDDSIELHYHKHV